MSVTSATALITRDFRFGFPALTVPPLRAPIKHKLSRDSPFEFVLMTVPPTTAMIKPKFAVPACWPVHTGFG
jgi:hypothetical protein